MSEEQRAPEETQGVAEGQAQEATEETVEEPQGAPEAPETQADDTAYWREQKKKADNEAINLRNRLKKFEEAEQKRQREAMSQAEQLEADKKAAEEAKTASDRRAEAAETRLREVLVRSEATTRALSAGAKQDRLDAVLRLTDLSGATDDDGAPDAKAIERAVKDTLKAYPEFRATAPDLGSGSNPPGEPPDAATSVSDMTPEQFADMQRRASLGERVTLPA